MDAVHIVCVSAQIFRRLARELLPAETTSLNCLQDWSQLLTSGSASLSPAHSSAPTMDSSASGNNAQMNWDPVLVGRGDRSVARPDELALACPQAVSASSTPTTTVNQ